MDRENHLRQFNPAEATPDEIVEHHPYVLEKMPAVGFGFAISGGTDNPSVLTGDTNIIISDVLPAGPSWNILKVYIDFKGIFFNT